MIRSKQKSRGPRLTAVAMLIAVTLAGPAFAGGTNLERVTFLAHWVPQAQFAGYYMAQAKGLYAQHGLEVTILPSGPTASPEGNLAEHKADFITRFLAVALEKREKDRLPLVNIAQIVQHSAVMVIALKSSGIRELKDLDGKTLYTWPDTQIDALLKRYNLNVRIIPKQNSNALFLMGGADAMSAMWYNEYHLLYNAGIDTNELQVFFAEQHGLNFPEDGLYCLQTTLTNRPVACRAFVAASLEGWRYAFAHTEETLDVVMARARAAHTGTNRAHQRWMLKCMRDLVDPDRIRMGTLSKSDYETAVTELIKGGTITNAPPLEGFYVDLAKPE